MLVNEEGKVMGAEDSAKDCCPASWDSIIEDCASKYASVTRRQYSDSKISLSASPQNLWSEVIDARYDITNIQCPELFTKEKPNGFTPNLDYVMSEIRDVIDSRKAYDDFESITPFEAELHGVYCALFLRANMEDILTYNTIVQYRCLTVAVEYLTNYYSREEIKSFWNGFKSYLPVLTNDEGINLLCKYSRCEFGCLMVYEYSKYCADLVALLKGNVIWSLDDALHDTSCKSLLNSYKRHFNNSAEASMDIPSGASEKVSNQDVLDSDVKVKCTSLFCRSNPNGYTPELDDECYQALMHSKFRIRPDYKGEFSPEKAESFGKYCGLFIRARATEWLKYKRLYNIPVLTRAAVLIEKHYTEMEVSYFWRGFCSLFPLDIENVDVNFISFYANTIFGKLILEYCIDLCKDLTLKTLCDYHLLREDDEDEKDSFGIQPELDYADEYEDDEDNLEF